MQEYAVVQPPKLAIYQEAGITVFKRCNLRIATVIVVDYIPSLVSLGSKSS